MYLKLAQRVQEFKESIPLIQSLKNGSIMDRHWEKLMKETGKKFEINLKTITLEQVFALNLQKFPEKVAEIVQEASNEANNEAELNKISHVWKTQQFETVKYARGPEDRGCFVLKNTDDIKLILEE